MKTLKFFALLALAGSATACEPGQIGGPNTAKVTIEIAMKKMVCDDVLKPNVNGEDVTPDLTLQDPVNRYRVRVQTYESSRYNSYYVEYGTVHVALFSTRRQRLSEPKSVSVSEDRVTLVEFQESDFGIPISLAKPCG